MTARSRFIKVRVSDGEYKALRQRADAQGVTMSEHVRATVTAVHDSLDVAVELAALRQQVKLAPGAPVNGTSTEHREMLLLLRELAAARDAQILARVRARLAAHVGNADERGGAA
ncbi:Mobilization protein [Bordetella sputigena]|uniref:plasmid mobilization protein n=1 Tax=Bordetella sputigena TaxID=1416810 RepID=UPI0039EF4DE0